METPHINSDRYVPTNSLRDTQSQSVPIARSTFPWSDNTDSGQRVSRKEDSKNNSSFNSITKLEEEVKEPPTKGT